MRFATGVRFSIYRYRPAERSHHNSLTAYDEVDRAIGSINPMWVLMAGGTSEPLAIPFRRVSDMNDARNIFPEIVPVCEW